MNNIKLCVLVGSSGSGKTTILNELVEQGYKRIITHTTRDPRLGEIDGVDYHFVTKNQFEKLEKVESNEYGGNLYGLSEKELDRATNSKDLHFAILEINGVKNVKKLIDRKVFSITLEVPSGEVIKRLKERGSTEKELKVRMELIEKNKEYDYKKHTDISIVNKDINKTISTIKNVLKI